MSADAGADLVVCQRAIPADQLPSILADSLYGECSGCGAPIMWRPYCPPAPKICFDCAVACVEASGKPAEIVRAPRALAEAKILGGGFDGCC